MTDFSTHHWAVVINGNEVVEVESSHLVLALNKALNQWRATTAGQRERRDVTSILVTRMDREVL